MTASCTDPCTTLYLNERAVPGHFTSSGAFSPDGTLLASPQGHRVAVVEVATGKVDLLPGTRIDPEDRPKLTWASSGWLFWHVGGTRIGAWRLGERARQLPVQVGASIDTTAS